VLKITVVNRLLVCYNVYLDKKDRIIAAKFPLLLLNRFSMTNMSVWVL